MLSINVDMSNTWFEITQPVLFIIMHYRTLPVGGISYVSRNVLLVFPTNEMQGCKSELEKGKRNVMNCEVHGLRRSLK